MRAANPSRTGVFVGLGVVAFACIVAWQAANIPHGVGYAQVGPTVAPWLVATMLAVLGIGIIAEGVLARRKEEARAEAQWMPLAWVGAGLLLNLALISVIGFILASTLLFAFTARGFGSRRPLRDSGIGFAVAFVAYLSFDRLLDYRIGGGLIENLL